MSGGLAYLGRVRSGPIRREAPGSYTEATITGLRVGLRLPPAGSSVTITLLTPCRSPGTPTVPSP